MEAVHCEKLSFTYNGSKKPALNEVSLDIKKGEAALITGASGCGKTTLLRMMKPALAPAGKTVGEVRIFGKKLTAEGSTIGFVPQHPERACVSDNVQGEVSFAPENMGLTPEEVQLRIAETASWFGIGKLFDRELSQLSGGELKLVTLCSAMTMRPDILLLDEPVSRLDPAAAESFMSAVLRLNRELGVTVIIAEHRTEGFFDLCDKVIPMSKGRVKGVFSPPEAASLMSADPELSSLLPCAARIVQASKSAAPLPLTVRSGREFLRNTYSPVKVPTAKIPEVSGDTTLECRDLRFAYSRSAPDILGGADLSIRKGEVLTLLGANGSGKTTLLKCLCGLLRPYSGRVKVFGKLLNSYKNGSLYRDCLALLPQDPTDVFIEPTVGEDLDSAARALGADPDEAARIQEKLGIAHLRDTHPYDLSGGELQLCALGRVLLSHPRVLLLDEPTKGLDPVSRERLTELLHSLKSGGTSILTVTHDLEFAAEISDRCGLFFGGRTSTFMPPRKFFTRSQLYTVPTVRICRGIFEGAYLPEEAREMINQSEV